MEVGKQPVDAAVIIPNWNGGKHLKECLESLARQSKPPSEIIVVDNGSTDSSWKDVPSILPRAKLIRLDRNHGFSYAVNRGVKESTAEWIVLLNNDVVLEADFLESLLTALDRQTGFDFAAAKLLRADRREIVDGAGDSVLRCGAAYRLAHGLPDGDFTQREVFAACGAAAAYRRSLVEELGGFDEDFFAYLEDVDLAFRAHWSRRRCLFVPSAVAYHWGSVSLGGALSPPIVRLITRNQILVVVKNMPLGLLSKVWMQILWYQLLWLGFAVKRGRFVAWARGVMGAIGKGPGAWRKGTRAQRLLDDQEMWLELSTAEKDVFEAFRVGEARKNTLLRAYFRLFPPKADDSP